MYNLPPNATTDQIAAIVREVDRREQLRLLAEYPPIQWHGTAEDWPAWTDDGTWELGPGPEEELADRNETMETLAILDASHPGLITDADVMTAAGCVG
jgi:hypothetical protein